MTIKVELLQQEALALLRNLENLKLIKLSLPKAKNGAATQPMPIGSEQAPPLAEAIKPIKKDLTLDELLKEQQFKGFDREEIDKLIAEINLQDPVEELLSVLKP